MKHISQQELSEIPRDRQARGHPAGAWRAPLPQILPVTAATRLRLGPWVFFTWIPVAAPSVYTRSAPLTGLLTRSSSSAVWVGDTLGGVLSDARLRRTATPPTRAACSCSSAFKSAPAVFMVPILSLPRVSAVVTSRSRSSLELT